MNENRRLLLNAFYDNGVPYESSFFNMNEGEFIIQHLDKNYYIRTEENAIFYSIRSKQQPHPWLEPYEQSTTNANELISIIFE